VRHHTLDLHRHRPSSVGCNSHEELRTVRILSAIRHRQQEGLVVFLGKVFVVECSTKNGLASFAVALAEVARLNHKVFHDTMECNALVVVH